MLSPLWKPHKNVLASRGGVNSVSHLVTLIAVFLAASTCEIITHEFLVTACLVSEIQSTYEKCARCCEIHSQLAMTLSKTE